MAWYACLVPWLAPRRVHTSLPRDMTALIATFLDATAYPYTAHGWHTLLRVLALLQADAPVVRAKLRAWRDAHLRWDTVFLGYRTLAVGFVESVDVYVTCDCIVRIERPKCDIELAAGGSVRETIYAALLARGVDPIPDEAFVRLRHGTYRRSSVMVVRS